MPRFVKYGVQQFAEERKAVMLRRPSAPSVFHSLDVDAQKTVFTYYLISRLFTSSLLLANLSHIKKQNTGNAYSYIFSYHPQKAFTTARP